MAAQFGLFYFKSRLRAGWLAARHSTQWRIVLADGTAVTYPPKQVLYAWDGQPDGPAAEAPARAELAAREGGLAAWEEPALETLHRKLPKGRELSFTAIAARALPAHADGWARAALYCALLQSPRLFRAVDGGFAALGAAQRRRREAEEKGARERAAWREKAADWRAALDAGRWRGNDDGAQRFLQQLESLLMEGRRSPHWQALAQTLGLRRGHREEAGERLRHWLESAGRWPGWPHLWLRWGGVAREFPPALERAAAKLAKSPPTPRGRADFRAHATYTIDAAGTRDLDDACTILDADGEGLTLAVHIAQTAAVLAPGHALFEEAARRMSSLYPVAGVVPMLPASLSAGRFSLLRGEAREVVSFTLRLTEAGGALLGVEQGLIRVTDNLDHGRADALLGQKPESWGRLGALCARLQAARAAKGAQLGERVDVRIDASDPRRIRLERHDRRGAAQRVVEELAVLLNREAGRYCRDHALPAIYRVQPRRRAPAGSTALDAVPDAPPAPARFTLRGAPHAGLACDRYIQVTSPLRRFADLVMQQQIIAHAARGRTTYNDAKQLRAWARAAEEHLAAYAELETRIANYWKRAWLAQHAGRRFSGTVRRVGKGGEGRVWLEEVQLLVDAEIPAGSRPGDALTCRVLEADPERHLARVTSV